jgi:hypothetical protein
MAARPSFCTASSRHEGIQRKPVHCRDGELESGSHSATARLLTSGERADWPYRRLRVRLTSVSR